MSDHTPVLCTAQTFSESIPTCSEIDSDIDVPPLQSQILQLVTIKTETCPPIEELNVIDLDDMCDCVRPPREFRNLSLSSSLSLTASDETVIEKPVLEY